MADAEDRTEAPSGKRLEQAREDGNIALSRELQSLIALSSGFLAILFGLSQSLPHLLHTFRALMEHAGDASSLAPQAALQTALLTGAILALPICATIAAAPLVSGLLQTGFLFRPAGMMPDLKRINPLSGLSRILGGTTLAEAIKAIAKCLCFGAILWWQIHAILHTATTLIGQPASHLLHAILSSTLQCAATLLMAQAVIAVLDTLWTHQRRLSKLKMSRQELKDEHRQTEGDPHVKGKLRHMRAKLAKQRMMEAVQTATVIVTNPTHYAVALAYDKGTNGAPKIVAKGADEVAARIRELAQDHRVPIVSNPPLARALFTLPLDTEVPAEHFKVVASIIAYVWKLKRPTYAQAALR